MYVIFFLSLTVVACAIMLIKNRKDLSAVKVINIILLCLLIFNVGLTGIYAFIGHTLFSDKVALSIGWQPGSPFQLEVAVSNLAFGVLGILCIFFRNGFWLATGIGYSVFLFGAAFVHIWEILEKGNYAINNAGPVLFIGDIFIPVLILVLLAVSRKLKDKAPVNSSQL